MSPPIKDRSSQDIRKQRQLSLPASTESSITTVRGRNKR